MKKMKWLKVVVFGCAMVMFSACDNSDEPMGKGEVDFEITDAPSDDASIKGVIVTIADIKVNGQSVSGFSKQTIDLKAYQEGNTKLLGSTTLDSKTYSNVTLVLDLDTDANGNSPGCYVLTQDDLKFKLKNTNNGKYEVNINNSWTVAKNVKNKVVMDFDLRKSIRYSDDVNVRYSFVSDNNMNGALRLVVKERAGTIKGSYKEDQSTNADRIIVYAYKKGTFNASVETQPQSVDNIYFKNAVTSAEVKASLTDHVYTLALLEEGEYELHFAVYSKDAATGKFMFEAMLQSETSVNGSVGSIVKITGGATINIATTIKGVI
ncbi:MAG: DUF4382 domain-containing protein [Bacteroidota bacterium]